MLPAEVEEAHTRAHGGATMATAVVRKLVMSSRSPAEGFDAKVPRKLGQNLLGKFGFIPGKVLLLGIYGRTQLCLLGSEVEA